MPFDPALAVDVLQERASRLAACLLPDIVGVPQAEVRRSPAAAAVAEHAAASGLFLFQFEHRELLPLPEDWLPVGRPDLGAPPQWQDGVLPEPKYQSFRHDLPLGSFHPGHRAKWATHELCHGLVGSAWHRGATRLELAQAARLAELLPVALWYFLDEVFLRRCALHQGQGALFRTFCPDCELVASSVEVDPGALERLKAAQRYLDGELAAIRRTLRLGVPQPHRWATLDLSSDALAYISAHGQRLESETFARFAQDFLVEDGGLHSSLAALEERVVATARALVGQETLPALAPTSAHGRWRWVAQDLGWRALQVRHETDGEAQDALDGVVERLATLVASSRDADCDIELEGASCIARAAADWQSVTERFVLPEVGVVFAVGYPLPVYGSALEQLLEGLASALPRTCALFGEALQEHVARFARVDLPQRRPIGWRFADWLAEGLGGPVAALARYEAALVHLPPRDATEVALGSKGCGPWRLARSWRVLSLPVDAPALYEDVGFGDVVGRWEHGALVLEDVDGGEVSAEHTHWAIGRGEDGAPVVLALDGAQAAALSAPVGAAALAGEWVDRLVAMGVLVPSAWTVSD